MNNVKVVLLETLKSCAMNNVNVVLQKALKLWYERQYRGMNNVNVVV